MNEAREAFINHGKRVTEGDEESRLGGLRALAFVRLAIAAVTAAIAVEAADVRRA